MKAYRDDIRQRMVGHGRDPDSCKVLFLVQPDRGRDAGGRARSASGCGRRGAAETIKVRLAHLSKVTNIDFGAFDLDAPLRPGLRTNGHQQTLDEFIAKAAGRSLRQAMSDHNATGLSVELIGTADDVAAQMGEVDAGGGRRRVPVLGAERDPADAGGDGGWADPGAAEAGLVAARL